MSPIFGRLSVNRLLCDPLNEKAFFWRSPKYLGSQTLIYLIDQGEASIRGNINLIVKRVTRLKPKFLALSFLQY